MTNRSVSNEYESRITNTLIAIDISDANFSIIDTIAPAAPIGLNAQYDSVNETVSLVWQKVVVSDIDLYRIYRSEISGIHTVPIDSNFAQDTTYLDSTIFLGRDYYYVVTAVDTNQNESEFSNEDSVQIPLAIYTNYSIATAYNQGHKIVVDSTGNGIHIIYADTEIASSSLINSGLLAMTGPYLSSRAYPPEVDERGELNESALSVPRNDGYLIYYRHSLDGGESFSRYKNLGSGLYPTLALNKMNLPCASWVKDSILYYSYNSSGASWTSANIKLPAQLSTPSMIVNINDSAQIIVCRYPTQGSNYGDLLYLRFPRTSFANPIIETLLVSNFCKSPSIAVNLSGNTNILWQGNNCICYRTKGLAGWSSIDTIYTTTTNEDLYPVLDIYGLTVTAVWQDKNASGNLQIYSRMKRDLGWEAQKQVISTPASSKYSSLAGAHYCLWQNNYYGNWEIAKKEYVDTAGTWKNLVNMSNTSTGSVYPHSYYTLTADNTPYLYVLWTEGDSAPYQVIFDKLQVTELAKVYIDVGQPSQSPYCLERDGYKNFGTKPYETIDYDRNLLRYQFTEIKPDKEYRLDVSYYFAGAMDFGSPGENSETDVNSKIKSADTETQEIPLSEREQRIDSIIHVLLIDSIPMDTAVVRNSELVRVSITIPATALTDSIIIIDFKKLFTGTVCGEIGLYEFNQTQQIPLFQSQGIQSNETASIDQLCIETLYPNPTAEILSIRFNSPDERNVVVQIYDATGRLVGKFCDSKAKIGMNELTINTDQFAAGIYFVNIVAGPDVVTRKAVFLR